MNPADITPMIITGNEEANVRFCLERLTWAKRVLVVDSGSTDNTLAICAKFPNVEVVHRAFDSFAKQCNWGLEQINSEWVLSMDADYGVPLSFPEVVQRLTGNADGYTVRFRYLIYGRSLRSSLYPRRTVLYRVAKGHYGDIGHGHRVAIIGPVKPLGLVIDHDDRKPLERWLNSQRRYAVREAEHLLAASPETLGMADRIRKRIWLAVPAIVLYVLFCKRCVFDGWAGIYYAMQRAYAELLLSLELLDRKLRKDRSADLE